MDGVTITDDNVPQTESDVTYVAGWDTYGVKTVVDGQSGTYDVCVQLGPPGDKRTIDCATTELTGEQSKNVTFTDLEWPTDATGRQTLSITVHEFNSSGNETPTGEPLEDATRQVYILREGNDLDDDGLGNREELKQGTDFTEKDTDGDKLNDATEVRRGANATTADSDGDGLSDGVEANKHGSDPTQTDTDGDGLSDSKEVGLHTTDPTKPDTDGDGLSDKSEVKKHDTEPGQTDTDKDGLSDGTEINSYKTDPTEADMDGDGLPDPVELQQKHKTDPSVGDSDGDGLGDGAEVNKYHTNPAERDTDGDGVEDDTEIERGTSATGVATGLLAYLQENPLTTAIGVGIVGLGLGAIGGWYWWRRRSAGESVEVVEDGDQAHDQPEPETSDPEPLTDEDHIWQLLEDNGGRVHQSEIVSETGWSKSKVSRLLTRMEDDGQITKITIGRENLITRSGDEPKHAGSTFED